MDELEEGVGMTKYGRFPWKCNFLTWVKAFERVGVILWALYSGDVWDISTDIYHLARKVIYKTKTLVKLIITWNWPLVVTSLSCP